MIGALAAEPSIDPAEIGVTVADGMVLLHGFVGSHAEKLAAEHVAQRTSGVEAIAEEPRLRHASDAKTADHEIAKRIHDILLESARSGSRHPDQAEYSVPPTGSKSVRTN